MSPRSVPRRYSRAELYELVWSEPMRTLSARFGLSDVALKKTCARGEIPVPPRGYWARRQAGKRMPRPPLPPRPPGMDEEITIGGRIYPGYPGLSEEELLAPLPDLPSFEEPIEAVRERARRAIGVVRAPRDLSRSHPAIGRLLLDEERREEKRRGSSFVLSWDQPRFNTPLARRRLRILSGLFTALDRVGGKGHLRGEEEEIGVSVYQQHVRLKLAPPAPLRSSRGRSATREEKPNRLRLSILSGYAGVEQAAWEDAANLRLESRLAEIATEIATTAEDHYREQCVRLHQWRAERKAEVEEKQRRQQEEAERQERERKAALEKERLDYLLGQAASFRQAADLRAYVVAVRSAAAAQNPPVDPEMLERWSRWALGEADRIDPVVSGAFLAPIVAP